MNIAYVRVSTIEQNDDRQIANLENYSIDKWFIEKVSAKNMSGRGELLKMLEFAREHDKIYIHDFSRIARNTQDLLSLVEKLESKNITLISTKESIDTSTPTGKLMLTMIGAINEFERTNLLERQREGIAIAKAKGKYKGRKAITTTTLSQFEELYAKYLKRELNKAQLSTMLHISRPTLNKLILEHNNKKNTIE